MGSACQHDTTGGHTTEMIHPRRTPRVAPPHGVLTATVAASCSARPNGETVPRHRPGATVRAVISLLERRAAPTSARFLTPRIRRFGVPPAARTVE
jgi:hypothetical protein